MKRTFANRPNWTRIIDKRFKVKYIEQKEFKGYVSIIYANKVKEPLVVNPGNKKLCIMDDGFAWIQYFPKDCNYALTTMFNDKQEVVQWYFDICDGNKINSSGIPYYDDLYLDVVLLPTGEMILLDEDELQQALEDKDITKDQYELAYREAQMIMKDIQENKDLLPLNSKWYLEQLI